MKKQDFVTFSKDRTGLILAAASALVAVVVCVLILVWLRPIDVQVPIRFSGFGVGDLRPGGSSGSYFNDRWYERLSFVVFAAVQAAAAIWMAIVMHTQGIKVLANFLLAFSIFINVWLMAIAFTVIRSVTL